jgi:tRNA (guanine37-N1)-methyltransferase
LEEILNKTNTNFEEIIDTNYNLKITREYIEIKDYSINLNYKNFTYYDTMKKILTLIKKECDEENIKNINNYNNLSDFIEIPNSIEIIGNIAHLNLRENFLFYKYLIGKIILDKNQFIKTVITKREKIDNEFRTYNMEIIAGEENYEVIHKEGDVNFHFDIRKVYWCSHLKGERDRLLNLIKKGSVLCDAFCGVGPLSLRAAKKGVKVYANDLNPDCFKYLNKNHQINKISKGKLYSFNLDAREFMRMCISQGLSKNQEFYNSNEKLLIKGEKIDYFYMNFPKDAIEFLDVFKGSFKNNEFYNPNNPDSLPIVHIYGFSNAVDYKNDLIDRICKVFNIPELHSKYLLNFNVVKEISTKKYMCCISIRIPPEVAFNEKN